MDQNIALTAENTSMNIKYQQVLNKNEDLAWEIDNLKNVV